MAPPALPDLNLNVDVSGNSCTCCSNNKRVVYDEGKGFYVDHGSRKSGCFFLCSGRDAIEREENARTWEAFQKAISSYGLSFEDVSELTGKDMSRMQARASKLKPHHFKRISSHAQSMRNLFEESGKESKVFDGEAPVHSREAPSIHLNLDVWINNSEGSS